MNIEKENIGRDGRTSYLMMYSSYSSINIRIASLRTIHTRSVDTIIERQSLLSWAVDTQTQDALGLSLLFLSDEKLIISHR